MRHLKGQLVADLNQADVIVIIGGDGFMLHSLHSLHKLGKPFYGINCGSVGFLLNDNNMHNLVERIEKAEGTIIKPLEMMAIDQAGKQHYALAINEVYLFRKTKQSAKITIYIDDKKRLEQLVCDGVILATPAGSTAYNFSVNGPIIPINSSLLALTPISPFRPRGWRGALLNHDVRIKFEAQNPAKRPLIAVADYLDVDNVVQVEIQESRTQTIHLLFDHNHALEERFMREQFQ